MTSKYWSSSIDLTRHYCSLQSPTKVIYSDVRMSAFNSLYFAIPDIHTKHAFCFRNYAHYQFFMSEFVLERYTCEIHALSINQRDIMKRWRNWQNIWHRHTTHLVTDPLQLSKSFGYKTPITLKTKIINETINLNEPHASYKYKIFLHHNFMHIIFKGVWLHSSGIIL